MPFLVRPYRRSRLVIASAAGIPLTVLLVAAWWVFNASLNKGKIEGKWSMFKTEGQLVRQGQFEDSILVELLRRQGLSQEDAEYHIQKGVWGGVGVLSLEFGKDMKLRFTVETDLPPFPIPGTDPPIFHGGGRQSSSIAGTYSLGARKDVMLKFDVGKYKDHVVKVAIDGDELTMTESNGIRMYFKKVE
jgi:hypothetical protein